MDPVDRPTNPFARCRTWLRWSLRIVLLFLVLLTASLVFLSIVGIPDLLSRPLLRQARSAGLIIEFDRLRLDWRRGLVAQSVVLAPGTDPGGPHFVCSEVALRPAWSGLRRLKFRIAAIELHEGQFNIGLKDPDDAGRRFTADSIAGRVRFQSPDHMQIDRLNARALGVRLYLSGTIANPSDFLPAHDLQSPDPTAVQIWRSNLDRALRAVESLRFSQEPALHLEVSGSARDWTSLTARVRLDANHAVTPWGDLDELRVHGSLNLPTGTNAVGYSQLAIEMTRLETGLGGVARGHLALGWAQAFNNPMPAQVDWRLDLQDIRSPWGTSPGLQLAVQAVPDPQHPDQLVGEFTLTSDALLGGFARADTNRLTARVLFDAETFLPTRADWQFHAGQAAFDLGSARDVRFHGRIGRLEHRPAAPPDLPAWGTWFLPLSLEWGGEIDELVLRGVTTDRLAIAGRWHAPALELIEFRAELQERHLELRGNLDVGTRRILVEADVNLDWRQFETWLTPRPWDWLDHLTWTEPPELRVTADLIWPSWKQTRPDLRAELLPDLTLSGFVQAGPIAYRGLMADRLSSSLLVSNSFLRIPDLNLRRPEGGLALSYTEHIPSGEYQLQARGRIHPYAVEPLLGLQEDRVLDFFHFRAPPNVQGELWGRRGAHDRFGVRATVDAADFSFRDEDIDEFSATIDFTNSFLHATDVQLRIGDEWILAPAIGFDLDQHWLHLTNVTTRIDPQRVAGAIGASTAEDLNPYQFLSPPRARIDGSVNVRDTRQSDMRFELEGGPFHYWRFRVPEIRAQLHWLNQSLSISNLHAHFYQGTLDGHLHAAIPRGRPASIRFHALVNRADFNKVVGDLFEPTKRLEGTLNLNLTITEASAADVQSWQGFGRADLQEGFLWDIPLFGLLSPVLNSVVPGLGRSRINAATASFRVTNSIVHTDDLELRAPLFRLGYRGTVDLNGRVNARVEARLLRDAWVVGPLVSLLFSPLTKLFEYQVTGTLARPEMDLVYIPKPLQFPLDPIGTIRDMLEDDRP